MSINDDQARKLAGDHLLVEFINLMEALQHDVFAGALRQALWKDTARDSELELDRLQDLLSDIGQRRLADALRPIVAAYYGPPPQAPQPTQAAPSTDPDASALRYHGLQGLE